MAQTSYSGTTGPIDGATAQEQATRIIGHLMSRWDLGGRPDVPGGIDALIARALASADLLATNLEWDVEYRHPDGSTIRHTDEVFDEAGLSEKQALDYADEYNKLDTAPGRAVVVHRWVTGWIEGDQP